MFHEDWARACKRDMSVTRMIIMMISTDLCMNIEYISLQSPHEIYTQAAETRNMTEVFCMTKVLSAEVIIGEGTVC